MTFQGKQEFREMVQGELDLAQVLQSEHSQPNDYTSGMVDGLHHLRIHIDHRVLAAASE